MAVKKQKKLNTDLDESLIKSKADLSKESDSKKNKKNEKKSDNNKDGKEEQSESQEDSADSDDYFTMGDIVYEDGNTDEDDKKILSTLHQNPKEDEEDSQYDVEIATEDFSFRDEFIDDYVDPDDDDQHY